jgi:hypothetical protein
MLFWQRIHPGDVLAQRITILVGWGTLYRCGRMRQSDEICLAREVRVLNHVLYEPYIYNPMAEKSPTVKVTVTFEKKGLCLPEAQIIRMKKICMW